MYLYVSGSKENKIGKLIFNLLHEILVCFSDTDGLLQLHQDFTTYEQHSPVCLWDIRLQPHLCLHSKSLQEIVTPVAVTGRVKLRSYLCISCFARIKNVSFVVPFRKVNQPWCKALYAVFIY